MINCRGYYSKSHSECEATIMNEAFIEMRLLFEKNIRHGLGYIGRIGTYYIGEAII